MSYQPLQSGFSKALFGAIEPGKFFDTDRIDTPRSIVENDYRRVIAHNEGDSGKIRYTIIIVIISAVLFITVVAIFQIVSNIIDNYYSKNALLNPLSNNTSEDVNRTLIANQNSLISTVMFALFCILASILLVSFLISILWKSDIEKEKFMG